MITDKIHIDPSKIRDVKRIFLTSVIGILGLLLALSGFDLIEISTSLVKYSGLGLIILAVVYYLFY